MPNGSQCKVVAMSVSLSEGCEKVQIVLEMGRMRRREAGRSAKGLAVCAII